MKQTKTILLTAIAVLFAFSATVYTSCKKDPCSGVNCQNGGTCSGGSCSCATGYTGTRCQNIIPTTLVYQNDTYTPITITMGGVTQTIPVGGSVSYAGVPNSAVTGSAYTSGTTTSGNQVGLLITWSLSEYFPDYSTGSQTITLDVSSSYFFLKINNSSAYNIGTVTVNNGLTSQTTDYVTLYNGGVTYNIGYYDAWTNSNLYLLSSGGSTYWSYNISLPFTTNQAYTFTAL